MQRMEQSRYHQVAEQLRQQMRKGHLRPGDRLPSYEEMRARGVSQNTMEKAHALLERENLVERRPRQGIFVAAPQRRSAPQRKGIIGLGSTGFSFIGASSYWSRVMQGMQEAAGSAGMQILLLDPESSAGWEKADGVLLARWGADRPVWLPENTPCASVLTPIAGMGSAITDDYAGGLLATQHLLNNGHRRISYIYGARTPVMMRRLQAYHDALREAAVSPDPAWEYKLSGQYDYGARFSDRGRESMTKWLAEGWQELGCTAILAHNDDVALGIIEALQQHGHRVPQDVSVVGFDGTEICDLSRPRLTSVEIPLRQIGRAAVELLVKVVESGESSGEHRVFPPVFKDGDSVAEVDSNPGRAEIAGENV